MHAYYDGTLSLYIWEWNRTCAQDRLLSRGFLKIRQAARLLLEGVIGALGGDTSSGGARAHEYLKYS
jgi:hypothetical protein